MKWQSERVQRLFERFAAEAVPWMEKRTVVIYGVTDLGNAVPEGTGVLLRVADRSFVISAGHVLEDWGERLFALSLGEAGYVDLTKMTAQVTSDDKTDLALIPVPDEAAQRLERSGRVFARLSETDPSGDAPGSGVHTVFGYPRGLAKPGREGGFISDAIYYPTKLADPATLATFDPGMDITLEIDVENMDADGDRARLPHFGGISGCGIWRLHADGDTAEEWSIDRVRLVGIEHRIVGKNEAIKGTRIRYVLAGLAQCFPELEREIALAPW